MANETGELSEIYKEVTWKIPNCSNLSSGEVRCATSPEFRLANATWYFRLYPTADKTLSGVLLVRSESSVPQHHLRYDIGLMTCRGDEYGSTSSEKTFTDGIGAWLFACPWSKIFKESELLLPNGTLTLYCKIRVMEPATPAAFSRPLQHRNEPSQTDLQEASSQTEVPESVNQTEVEEASASVQKLQLDYSNLLESEEDSDVCLKVSGKEFRAHRCILRARSKVFSAMFKYETEGKTIGEVVIDDLDPDAFPDFLQHVYAGRVESITPKNVSSLYTAADKYDLQELKSECREYVKRTLSVDTFCDVMTLALRCKEEELLKLAIEFFSKNLTEIIVTVQWQTFSKDYNTEANELLIKALVPGGKNESQ